MGKSAASQVAPAGAACPRRPRAACRPPVLASFGLLLVAVAGIASGASVTAADVDSAEAPAARRPPVEAEAARIYRTREEQREAGLKREITPWLALSGLAEAELSYERYGTAAAPGDGHSREGSATLQLGLFFDLFGPATAEAILEYDTDTHRVDLDEAFVTIEHDPWELSAGRQYTPFGVYFSSFVTGPLIEFGETRSDRAFTLAYGPSDALDLAMTLYRGRDRNQTDGRARWHWALAVEARTEERWALGLSLQSDLADADSRLLEDANDRYRTRVPGVSGFLQWSGDRSEATLEVLAATRPFAELDPRFDRPRAWNAEYVRFFPENRLELALRVEGSENLEDEPALRYGAAVTWRAGRHLSLSLEYLRGEFREQAPGEAAESAHGHADRVAGRLSLEF